MNFDEKTLSKAYIYNGKILNVRRDDVLLPDGSKAVREVIEHSGGSAVLCEMDGKVLMVKQFRYPHGESIWEIPAGKRNQNEPPEVTAIRELEEEGGVIAEKVEKIFEVYPTPAYAEEVIHIFKAIGVKKGKVHLDDDEFLTSKWFTKDELKQMLQKGEIKDAKTLIAINSML